MRGAALIRVLIADQVARIVGDLEKLAPYDSDVDVCGVAHNPAAVIEEAWLRQPDVLLLHETFAEPPAEDFAAHLETVSPATRVLLMTSRGAGCSRAAGPQASMGEQPPTALRSSRRSALPRVSCRTGGGTTLTRLPRDAASAEAPLSPRRAPSRPRDADRRVLRQGRDRHVDGRHQPRRCACRGCRDPRRGDRHRPAVRGCGGDAPHRAPSPFDRRSCDLGRGHRRRCCSTTVLATGPAERPGAPFRHRAPSSPSLVTASPSPRDDPWPSPEPTSSSSIDTPSQFDERTLEAFELADRVLLVSSYNMTLRHGDQGGDRRCSTHSALSRASRRDPQPQSPAGQLPAR